MPEPQNNEAEFFPRKNILGRLADWAVLTACRFALKKFYGCTVKNPERFDAVAGKPTVIIANHVSQIDGMLLSAFLPVKNAVFVMDKEAYEEFGKSRLNRFLFARINIFALDRSDRRAVMTGLKTLIGMVRQNIPIIIFPEGQQTPTGGIMQISDGAAIIAEEAGAHILPVHLGGLEFVKGFSDQAKDFPKQRFPKLTVSVGEARRIVCPEKTPPKDRKILRHEFMGRAMHELPLLALDPDMSLIDALRGSAKKFGMERGMLNNSESHNPSYKTKYRDILDDASVLGDHLASMCEQGQSIGFMLPNSIESVKAFWGTQAAGLVPAMLNPAEAITDHIRMAGAKTVLTSRAYVEKLNIENRIQETGHQIIYLEDIAATKPVYSMQRYTHGQDPAVIIFTKNHDGHSKAVVLSSANILSNIAQMRSVTAMTPEDTVFNPLPYFQAFGLIEGMIMPLLGGMRSVQYPSPNSSEIPNAVYLAGVTVLPGTDALLKQWAKSASNEDFSRLKHVFAGAGALQKDTCDMYAERFGIVPSQGFGVAEASPVIAVSARGRSKNGTVGKILPGLDIRIDPVEGIAEGGRLFIKGPNVMKGYLQDGVIVPPPDGWHDVNAIASVDMEGFLTLHSPAP